MAHATSNDPEHQQLYVGARRTAFHAVWRGFKRNPLALVGVLVIGVFMLIALLAPWIAPYAPGAVHLSQALEPPSLHHLFGTDDVGGDVFSRVLYGARIDLTSVVIVVSFAGGVGTAIGILAGWLGGWWDEALMRVTDMFLAFPSLILAMAISAILKPDLLNALIAISVTWWPVYARLGRGQAISLKHREFMESAKSVGASNARLVLVHLVPNAISPLLVQATLDMGTVLLVTAGLSFIGFGAQPPSPEWGRMVSDGQSYLMTQWWISTFPAAAIFLLVMGFNLIGDALRDLLDPRQN